MHIDIDFWLVMSDAWQLMIDGWCQEGGSEGLFPFIPVTRVSDMSGGRGDKNSRVPSAVFDCGNSNVPIWTCVAPTRLHLWNICLEKK